MMQPSSETPTAETMQALVVSMLGGLATESDQHRLHGLVTGSEAGRRMYVETMCDELLLSAVLRDQADEEMLLPAGRLRNLLSAAYQFISHPMALSALISGLFVTSFVLSLALVRVPEFEGNRAIAPPSRADYVARIYDVEDAQWKVDAGKPPRIGDDLMAGQRLALTAGFARLLYDNGTTVLLEGPTEFAVAGVNAGSLDSGRTVVRVPPKAVGFVLNTPRATIVDLGTEFGTSVDGRNDVEVAVFEGKVRLEAGDETQVIEAGGSLRVGSGGIEPGAGRGGFARRLPREEPGAYSQAVLAAEPLAYYRLSSVADELGDRLTANGVQLGRVRPSPPLNAAGGFPGFEYYNHWANFSGASDGVLTDLKSGWSSQSGTIMYWVRMDDEGHATQTHLFAGESGRGGFGGNLSSGCIGTFARRDGSFGIVIDGVQIDSPQGAINNVSDWNHFAFTWQRGEQPDGGRIEIYLNGELVDSANDLDWSEFTVATARFGKEISGETRILQGSADEIVILARRLSVEEVHTLHRSASTGAADEKLEARGE